MVFFGDDEKKCELLHKYLVLISKQEDENAPHPELQKYNSINVLVILLILFIKIIDLKKTSKTDVINNKMLNIFPNTTSNPLQIIFNKSFQQCKYPTNWKLVNVITAFKEKRRWSLPSNYRPILLINCIGK